MGYGRIFPANQPGGQILLWDIIEYGLLGIWFRRESTVFCIAHESRVPVTHASHQQYVHKIANRKQSSQKSEMIDLGIISKIHVPNQAKRSISKPERVLH